MRHRAPENTVRSLSPAHNHLIIYHTPYSDENQRKRLHEIQNEKIAARTAVCCAIVSSLLLLVVAGVIIWLGIHMQSEGNDGIFIVLIIFAVGFSLPGIFFIRGAWSIYHYRDENVWYINMFWPSENRYDPDEHDTVKSGIYRKRYYAFQWQKLKDSQKIDYFLAYYSREYRMNLYDNIAEILVKYIEEPKVKKQVKYKTVSASGISKREQYLKKTNQK